MLFSKRVRSVYDTCCWEAYTRTRGLSGSGCEDDSFFKQKTITAMYLDHFKFNIITLILYDNSILWFYAQLKQFRLCVASQTIECAPFANDSYHTDLYQNSMYLKIIETQGSKFDKFLCYPLGWVAGPRELWVLHTTFIYFPLYQVGVVQFGNHGRIEINLDWFYNANSFQSNASGINHMDENTNTTGMTSILNYTQISLYSCRSSTTPFGTKLFFFSSYPNPFNF